MNAITIETVHRHAAQLFVAAITIYLLARIATQAGHGTEALIGTLVYALAAGFGLEFLSAAWTGRWRERGARRELQR